VDEEDIPLGLYAAPVLIEKKNQQSRIMDWIRLAGGRQTLLPPAALRIARDAASQLRDADAVSRISNLIRNREQAEALQRDFTHLTPALQDHGATWVPYGDPVWLVSLTQPAGDDGLLIAVSADDALRQLRTSPVRISLPAEKPGQALGDNFPGFRVVTPEPEHLKTGSRQTFFVAALVLALLFTLVAGYLLWRDVQRDLRTAAMRSQFVSSVTHELKTPLTAIRIFTETLRLDEEVDTNTRNDYLDTILHEAERLSRLVDNVLDFGKIERGKKTYRFEPVRLDEVVHHAARIAQYPLEQAGFTLEIEADQELPVVRADSDALQQAILNLLINAMKYSGDSRRIALRLDRLNGHARIRVEDHGIGIDSSEQQRIFESFYRAPIAENQHIPGTGLGLTIVAHIAKAHGGRVEVASRPGDGSSFMVYLPVEGKA
jgi:signal transduction histidine kinase